MFLVHITISNIEMTNTMDQNLTMENTFVGETSTESFME